MYIKKMIKIFLVTFGVVLVFSFCLRNVIAQDSRYIFNSNKIELKTRGEAYTDVSVNITRPNKISEEYFLGERDGNGMYSATLKLGEREDERLGCVAFSNLKRTGICEDGMYVIDVIDRDAAGNFSVLKSIYVERDTVKPSQPNVSLQVNEVNYTINLKITDAEPNTLAKMKIFKFGEKIYEKNENILNIGSLEIKNIIGVYSPSTEYSVQVQLEDKAHNLSDIAIANIITPVGGFCVQTDNVPLTYPLRGKFIQSIDGDFFSLRNFDGRVVLHKAQDFTYSQNALGKPVYAAAKGKIKFMARDKYGGLYLDIYHPDLNLTTRYLHLKAFSEKSQQAFRMNRLVNNNTVIGYLGSTGFSTGPHLHFEVILDNGTKVDPLRYLGECVEEIHKEEPLKKGKDNVNYQKVKHIFKNRERESGGFEVVQGSQGEIHEVCGVWIKDYKYFRKNQNDRWDTYTNLIYNPALNKTFVLRGDIRLAFWNKYEGTCGDLKFPITDDLWASPSPYGTSGAYQEFDGKTNDGKKEGVIHSSKLGTFASLGEVYKIHLQLNGTAGRLGFPISEMKKATNYYYQLFEGGRLPDNRSDAEKAIDERAQILGSKKISNLFETCGYKFKYVEQISNNLKGEGIILYTGSKAVVSYGGVYRTYKWFGDRCERFGIPIEDQSIGTNGPSNTFGYFQNFSKPIINGGYGEFGGRIYWSKKHEGKFVYGKISKIFEDAGGTSSKFGWPKSEVYKHSENGVNTKCQDYEGERICEDKIIEKNFLQLMFEAKLNREILLSEIYEFCGFPSVDLNNGIAIYSSSEKSVKLVTGDIFKSWFSKCETYGEPVSDTSRSASKFSWGYFQRFINDKLIYDFYQVDGGEVLILEGIPRNIVEREGGLAQMGYPLKVFQDESDMELGTCIKAEAGQYCERIIEEWEMLLKNKVEDFGVDYKRVNLTSICNFNQFKAHLIPDGLVYYDPYYKNIRVIRGSIYMAWQDNGACNTYGLPENNTEKVFGFTGTPGFAQRFHKDYQVFDFYVEEQGGKDVVILEGNIRNVYNDYGGLGRLGFPQNSFDKSIKVEGVCGSSGNYWRVENGIIYRHGEHYWVVYGNTQVGRAFFENGAETWFGLPMNLEKTNNEFSYQDFNSIRIIYNYTTNTIIYDGDVSVCPDGRIKQVCGNGKIEFGEACDDGNTDNGDQCSSDCRNVCNGEEIWDQEKGVCRIVLECEDSPYKLPWQGGTTQRVNQGPGSAFSHSKQPVYFGWDFSFSVNTPVMSVADGEVLYVVDRHPEINNYKESCNLYRSSYANMIYIKHDDGKISFYLHLSQYSAQVGKGDRVRRGQHIANTGLTGFVCGAHLHFSFIHPDEEYRLNISEGSLPSKYLNSAESPLFSDKSVCNTKYRGKLVVGDTFLSDNYYTE
jgi:cysteine-rich repeat protein